MFCDGCEPWSEPCVRGRDLMRKKERKEVVAPTTIEKQIRVNSMVFQLTESTKPFKISANVSAVTRAVPTTAGSRAEHRSQFLHALARAGACMSVPHRLAVYAAAHAVISDNVSAQ